MARVAAKGTKTTKRIWLRVLRGCFVFVLFVAVVPAQQPPPELAAPVNDFAHVIDAKSAAAMESLIRSLQQASGDVVVVATVDTFSPYADLQEYAVEMFENRGRGIGQRGKDNGVLVVLAVKDRAVRIEVGYDLEQFITDGFAGETSRQYMAPEFRRGDYGAGLLAGVSRVISRIADERNVTLQGVPRARRVVQPGAGSGGGLVIALLLFILVLQIAGRMLGFGGRRRWRRGWGGYYGAWHSGVGPFGGGFGRGGGGFGGGFGGFGGGRSGGGGGGASW